MNSCSSVKFLVHSTNVEIFVEEHHEDLLEVCHHIVTDGTTIIRELVPHLGKWDGNYVHYRNTCRSKKKINKKPEQFLALPHDNAL